MPSGVGTRVSVFTSVICGACKRLAGMKNIFQRRSTVFSSLVWLAILAISSGIVLANPAEDSLQRAVEFVQQGDLKSAEEAIQPALQNPETRPISHAVLGSLRLQQKRYREGTELLERAIKANPL